MQIKLGDNMKPTINNDIYNQMSDGWWETDSFLNILETGIHPIRSHYIKSCLKKTQQDNNTLLDIGCGGGIITEDMAKQGFIVSGIDISSASLNTAKQHAIENKLNIHYQEAPAEQLPFENNSFDVITCCDVLEHVDDVDQVISEVSRVLKPKGFFIYDTINKTLMSRIGAIEVAQNIPWTCFMPKNTHVWHKFIRPNHFKMILQKQKLNHIEQQGMGPSINPLRMVHTIRQLKTGKIDYATFGHKTKFEYTKSKAISYLGCAQKC